MLFAFGPIGLPGSTTAGPSLLNQAPQSSITFFRSASVAGIPPPPVYTSRKFAIAVSFVDVSRPATLTRPANTTNRAWRIRQNRAATERKGRGRSVPVGDPAVAHRPAPPREAETRRTAATDRRPGSARPTCLAPDRRARSDRHRSLEQCRAL